MRSDMNSIKRHSSPESQIVLATLNARYIHSSFGLRYIKANMAELEENTTIVEFTLDPKPEDIAEQLLSLKPQVLAMSVYIWNTVQTQAVLAIVRELKPDLPIIVGGPEVSYEIESQVIFSLVDYVVAGWGDISVPALCHQLIAGERPQQKIVQGEQPKLCEIKMPYHLYTDEDVRNRVIYVEASRGCPYKCEFCLSALDKTAWPFDVELFLAEMDKLYQRGVRQFKFVDRTFNLNIKVSQRILNFFLERMDDDMFLHFELIPDNLPEALKETIKQFPEGRLQFEIGIQTFNPDVQKLISRRQKNDKAAENLRWLREETTAYLHTDLIFGLPSEGIDSFAKSFDLLYSLQPQEIQIGILKRLKGSPIVRHTEEFQLRFNPNPPFNILSTRDVSFAEMQKMNRFARFWDMLANSGRFRKTLPLMIDASPFALFSKLSEAMYARFEQTHKIALLRLFDGMHDIAIASFELEQESFITALIDDFERSGLKSKPRCLIDEYTSSAKTTRKSSNKANSRQLRH